MRESRAITCREIHRISGTHQEDALKFACSVHRGLAQGRKGNSGSQYHMYRRVCKPGVYRRIIIRQIECRARDEVSHEHPTGVRRFVTDPFPGSLATKREKLAPT